MPATKRKKITSKVISKSKRKVMPPNPRKKGNIHKAKIVTAQRGSESSGRRYLSASKEIASAVKDLRTFTNPTYTDTELQYFEDAWANSVAGTAMDKKMEFVMGRGVKPTFELIEDKDLTPEQKESGLKKFDVMLDELIQLDIKLGFNNKLFDAAVMAKVFGRCVLTWEQEGTKIVRPGALKVIHPRDTGRVFLNQDDWSLEMVTTFNPSASITPPEMIYLVNRPDSPIRKTQLFGFSELQRVIGAARSWRRIVEFDMPEITTAMWASYGMFLVKKMGRNSADTDADLRALLESLKPGAFNAVAVEATDDIQFMTADLDPKVKELVDLADFYERIMIGNFAVPSALLGREEDQNRATLIGKIRFFIEGPVESDREWLADIIGPQWYERNLIALGHKEILNEIRVKPEFEPIFVENWMDMIEGVTQLKSLFPGLPDERLLELLKLEEFENDLEQVEQKEVLDAKTTKMHSRQFQIQALEYLKSLNKTTKNPILTP